MFNLKRIGQIAWLFLLPLILTGCEGGIQFPNFQKMIVTVSYQFPQIWKLVTAIAYIFGMAFVLRGVYMLKIYGDMRTMMSGQANLKGALTLLLVGSALVYSPTMYHSLLLTTFNTTATSPIQYQTLGTTLAPDTVVALLSFVQLIGLISFIRGWIMLTHSSNPGGQSSFGKSLTHIIGGLFAINIQGTIDMFRLSFGI